MSDKSKRQSRIDTNNYYRDLVTQRVQPVWPIINTKPEDSTDKVEIGVDELTMLVQLLTSMSYQLQLVTDEVMYGFDDEEDYGIPRT